jgi:hypothetical protein
MTNSTTSFSLDQAALIFADFIFEGRKLERLQKRGILLQVSNLHIIVKELLIHLPIQLWPLPYGRCCPNAFCDDTSQLSEMEDHLMQKYPQLFHRQGFYTELQLGLAA